MATRFDPFREMDRLMASVMAAPHDAAVMPLDLIRDDDHYMLSMDLPGADPGSIDVSVEDRTLTIRAERTRRSGNTDWLVRERPSGTHARQLTLGRGLALDKVTAAYADGVLSLTIPVSENVKPRKIEIAHSSDPATPEQTTIEQPHHDRAATAGISS